MSRLDYALLQKHEHKHIHQELSAVCHPLLDIGLIEFGCQ